MLAIAAACRVFAPRGRGGGSGGAGGQRHVQGFRVGAGVRPRARDRDGGSQVLRRVGPLAPRDAARAAARSGAARAGRRVRRLERRLHRGERGRPRGRAGPRYGLPGPVLRSAHTLVHLLGARGRHPPAVRRRPAQHAAPRRSAARDDGPGRSQPVGAGVRVLPVRRRGVRERDARRQLSGRVGGGDVDAAASWAAGTPSRATAATTRSRRATTCRTRAPGWRCTSAPWAWRSSTTTTRSAGRASARSRPRCCRRWRRPTP